MMKFSYDFNKDFLEDFFLLLFQDVLNMKMFSLSLNFNVSFRKRKKRSSSVLKYYELFNALPFLWKRFLWAGLSSLFWPSNDFIIEKQLFCQFKWKVIHVIKTFADSRRFLRVHQMLPEKQFKFIFFNLFSLKNINFLI